MKFVSYTCLLSVGRLLFYLCVDKGIVNMVKKNDKVDAGYGDYVKQNPWYFLTCSLEKRQK